jgi:tetratricopeptide (TPR) repeat protein
MHSERGQIPNAGVRPSEHGLDHHGIHNINVAYWNLGTAQLLEKAVQRAPDVARYRYHLGKAYANLGRSEDARDQYTRVLDLDPGGPWEQQVRAELPTLPPAR